MPELPEVETMVRGIRPALVDRVIDALKVHDPFLLQGVTAQEFERRASGALVRRVDRRGKWVVIDLADDRGIIVIQPRMSGGFRFVSSNQPEHIRLTFLMRGSGESVHFFDVRRLGKVTWYSDREAAETAFGKSHGPDALEIEADDLAKRISGTTRGIKPTLLDQKILAGVGNIYADEILFHSGIHPERPASELSRAEIHRIHQAIGRVLAEAINAEGSSFDTRYRTVLGRKGGYLERNAVYGRGGKPCLTCSGPILKAKIAGLVGRPTHYCPNCQVLKPSKTKKLRRD
jgi:formamidopyrimidine-DNA glycosylase